VSLILALDIRAKIKEQVITIEEEAGKIDLAGKEPVDGAVH
jgi:hypothetical protein